MRVPRSTVEKLDVLSRRRGQTRSQLANALLEEGLRIEAHPGIVFRSGPGGRRPGLAGGPDIWEVARVMRVTEKPRDVAELAQLTGLTPEQIRVAARCYGGYRTEVDAWIDRVDDDAREAEAVWQRERDILEAPAR